MDRNWQSIGEFQRQNGAGDAGFRHSNVQPEVLPPAEQERAEPYYTSYPSPEPAVARRRSPAAWAAAPATYVLMGINGLVFLGMTLSGVSFISPTIRQLLHWGANNGTLVLQYGEWWRLVTAMFVHVGIIHIATNMWCLWNLGLLAEPLMGPLGVFAAYLLTGLAGNLLSVAVHPGVTGAGASGAVFGLAGVLIVLLKSPLLPMPQVELKRLRRSVIQFALLNLAIGLYTAIGPSPVRIDNMAHLGGFLSGLAFGVPLVPRIGAPVETFLRRRRLAIVGMAFALALFFYGIRSYWLPAAR
ncbi:MAG: rhomboid family intramembrane serine protease [Silvibacterium sp.]|nr:rhomboid family intramembrane serine protease [Silvibacterium sp.]